MAKSSEVSALDDGIVTKSNYRGNVQAIPVTFASTAAGTHDVSAILPQEARVILASITSSTGTCKLGYAADDDAVSADVNTTFFGNVDVGGKLLQIVTSATATHTGVILIATNE